MRQLPQYWDPTMKLTNQNTPIFRLHFKLPIKTVYLYRYYAVPWLVSLIFTKRLKAIKERRGAVLCRYQSPNKQPALQLTLTSCEQSNVFNLCPYHLTTFTSSSFAPVFALLCPDARLLLLLRVSSPTLSPLSSLPLAALIHYLPASHVR